MNTIVVLIDSLRRDHVGAYGPAHARTPALDEFARKAVRFDNAYLGSFPCMPARREIWTARYEFPWRGWGPLEPDDTSFPQVLRAAGKTSQLVTDHYHLWERGSGNYHFDFTGAWFIRGQESDTYVTDPTIPIQYPADPAKLAGHARPGAFERYARNTSGRKTERDYFAPRVFESAMDWLDQNHKTEDFCLVIDCFDPHEPWDPPQHYVDMYDPGYTGEKVIWPTYGDTGYLSPVELQHVRALYAGKVTMVDRWLGHFLKHVENLGLMDETTIIVTTDHGCMLGEHQTMGKPWAHIGDGNLYEELSHIPLLIYTPGCPGGAAVSTPVQLVDIGPTVLESCGVEAPPGRHGKSLLGLAREGAGGPERGYAYFGRFGECACVTDGEWVLYKWPAPGYDGELEWHSFTPPTYAKFFSEVGPMEGQMCRVKMKPGGMPTALFHLAEDPGQERDLAGERPDQVERLAAELGRFLRSIGAPGAELERLGV